MIALDLVTKQGAVFSAILPGSASTAVTDSAAALNAACNQIAESVRFFNVDDATYLPAYIGERLAVGIGAAELVMGSTRAATDMYFAADSDPNPDSVRFEAASDFIGHRTATVAAANVRIFMDWCRKEFEEKSGA
ncbi:hypothetical protein CIW53_16275 [Rhodanobacter sp. T12-5]|nr:hypothetical protein CIW53_16275 [Rhodanobacter sp. T12-5]